MPGRMETSVLCAFHSPDREGLAIAGRGLGPAGADVVKSSKAAREADGEDEGQLEDVPVPCLNRACGRREEDGVRSRSTRSGRNKRISNSRIRSRRRRRSSRRRRRRRRKSTRRRKVKEMKMRMIRKKTKAKGMKRKRMKRKQTIKWFQWEKNRKRRRKIMLIWSRVSIIKMK